MDINDKRRFELITKETVKIFKLMTGEFAIASEQEDFYDNLHYLHLAPKATKEEGVGIEFIPIGVPIYIDHDIKIAKDELDAKVFIDFTDIKNEGVDNIKDIFVKFISQKVGGIILPDSKIVLG